MAILSWGYIDKEIELIINSPFLASTVEIL